MVNKPYRLGDVGQALLVPYTALAEWVSAVLRAHGMETPDAALAAEMLVRTDARGLSTHGVARLKSYLSKSDTGEIDLRAKAEVAFSDGTLTWKANRQLGQVAAPRAIDKMIERVRDRAIVAGLLVDSGHLGALGVTVLRAAEVGLVAAIFQATAAVMSVPGARGPIIGNNPLALAAPRRGNPPLVIDMACSVAARGNILLASRNGVGIPRGWAINAKGEETTDPNEALLGSLLPFGGHKGMLTAMLVETLAGSLTGGAFRGPLNKDGEVRSAGICNALLLVLNPAHLGGVDAYYNHMEAWTSYLARNGAPVIRAPGERAYAAERDAKRYGISLADGIADELRLIGENHGIAFPAAQSPLQA